MMEGAETEAETTLHKAVPKNFKALAEWLPKASYAGDGTSLTSRRSETLYSSVVGSTP